MNKWFKPMSPLDPHDPLAGVETIKPPLSRAERREKEHRRQQGYYFADKVKYVKGDRMESINIFR